MEQSGDQKWEEKSGKTPAQAERWHWEDGGDSMDAIGGMIKAKDNNYPEMEETLKMMMLMTPMIRLLSS